MERKRDGDRERETERERDGKRLAKRRHTCTHTFRDEYRTQAQTHRETQRLRNRSFFHAHTHTHLNARLEDIHHGARLAAGRAIAGHLERNLRGEREGWVSGIERHSVSCFFAATSKERTRRSLRCVRVAVTNAHTNTTHLVHTIRSHPHSNSISPPSLSPHSLAYLAIGQSGVVWRAHCFFLFFFSVGETMCVCV